MADALAECGAKVAILALNQEACDAKAESIKAERWKEWGQSSRENCRMARRGKKSDRTSH